TAGAHEYGHAVMIARGECRIVDESVAEIDEAGHPVGRAAVQTLGEVVARAVEGREAVLGRPKRIDLLAAEGCGEDIGPAGLVRPEDPSVIVVHLEDVVRERIVPAFRELRVELSPDIALIAGGMSEADRIARFRGRR